MKKRTISLVLIAVVAVAVLLGAIVAIRSYCSIKSYEVSVTGKDIKNYEEGSKYLIYTRLENGKVRVFTIEDSILLFRWNSSDVYAEIQVGQTYEFAVIGWRIPIFSMYENIKEVKNSE